MAAISWWQPRHRLGEVATTGPTGHVSRAGAAWRCIWLSAPVGVVQLCFQPRKGNLGHLTRSAEQGQRGSAWGRAALPRWVCASGEGCRLVGVLIPWLEIPVGCFWAVEMYGCTCTHNALGLCTN